ncbi:myelin basic protein isoform X1 [Scleropages formosus]|uniref:Myelin basic protein n=1 Tax=Scleropages formosus TaxID=113540 RepID=A0A8C9TX68_SCLFO|nr:myelin basic protein isoform X1 [Scleropages formosus]
MATASTSGQAPFGLGKRKKNPGLLDQLGRFFGGDRRRKGKGSFRGSLTSSPQRPLQASPHRRGDENAVVHFFRTMVSPPPPKSRWRGLASKLGRAEQKSTQAGRADGQGTLSRIFKMGGSRSGSPAKR